MKILLVDDEQSLLDVFTSTLHSGGFEVITALTGTEGINKAKTQKPDLVLLDQVMPDINGNQVLQILKQDPTTQMIPVAMLSNFNQDGLVQDAVNLGAVDYILKYQIEPQDLIQKINQLIQEHGASKVQMQSSAPLVPPTQTQVDNGIPSVQPPITAPSSANPLTPPVSQSTEQKQIETPLVPPPPMLNIVETKETVLPGNNNS